MSLLPLSFCRIALATCLLVAIASCTAPLQAELVLVSIADPIGTQDVDKNSRFIGIVDQVAPLQIGGQEVKFNKLPANEAFQIGDLIGRDIDGTNGSRQWEYNLTLPNDAIFGTGFQGIMFSGHAFERDGNNLEGDDELTWELFLNNSSTAVDSGSTGAGVDFNSFDVNLSNAGGATINDIRVVFSVTGFNGGNETFATRGILSASYMAVPESRALFAILPLLVGLCLRRRMPSC